MPIDKMLNGLGNSTALTGALSGAAGGALVSAFTNKKSAKKLLKAGGLLAVGGFAWQAYQSYRTGQQAGVSPTAEQPPAPVAAPLDRSAFDAVVETTADNGGPLLVLQAMISAAHADGQLDAGEQQKIWQQAVSLGLPSDSLADLESRLKQPADIDSLAAAATNLETKIELYTASLMVIDESCEQGQFYLASLAARMQLPTPLVEALSLHAAQSQVAA